MAPRLARWLALGAMLAAATPAAAHAVLVRSTPPARATLAEPPERVQLWFNERLEPAYSSLSVWNAAGAQVDARDAAVGADDPKRLGATLPPIPAGAYVVKYRVLSVDGHVVDSSFPFTVRPKSASK